MKASKRKRETGATQRNTATPAKRAEKPHDTARTQPQRESVPAAGVVLGSNCNVKDAAALKAALCELVDESAEVTIDAGNLERIDTASMQILCAFVCDRAARDRKVAWLGNSQALQQATRLLGAQALLALPSAELEGAAA